MKHPKDMSKLNIDSRPNADQNKLQNLLGRRKIYGDITQNASPEDIEKLLRFFDNHVPSVIGALVDKIKSKGTKTYIPPAFYERNGIFVQPPAFEMPFEIDEEYEKNGVFLPPSTSYCLNCATFPGQKSFEKTV